MSENLGPGRALGPRCQSARLLGEAPFAVTLHVCLVQGGWRPASPGHAGGWGWGKGRRGASREPPQLVLAPRDGVPRRVAVSTLRVPVELFAWRSSEQVHGVGWVWGATNVSASLLQVPGPLSSQPAQQRPLLWVPRPGGPGAGVMASVYCDASQSGLVGGVAGVSVGEYLCADGKAMKSPQCPCQGCLKGFGVMPGGRWPAGQQLAPPQGCPCPLGLPWSCRGDTVGSQGGPSSNSSSLPPGPGPRPVPSPAGSPGQHHGRRPGSPGAPGRGLLDPQAPGRVAQGLLRLCVQAPRPAGARSPGP